MNGSSGREVVLGGRYQWPSIAGPIAVGLFVGTVSWAAQHRSYDVWGGLLIAPVLVAVTAPVALRTAHREGDRFVSRLVVAALLVKLVGSLVRYAVAFDLYGGKADATAYHEAGVQIARSFRQGIFHVDLGRQAVVGTGFIKIVTGVVYAIIGPTKLGGFLVFSWIGFLGLYLFYRAFCLAFPDGDRRRYAVLVFFLPSLVFWPSSIGKDAWMIFSIGLAAYGGARLLTRASGGFLVLGLGLAATGAVRPTITLLIVAAIVVAYLLRRTPHEERTALTPLVKLAGIAVIAVAAVIVAQQASSFLQIDNLSPGSVGTTLSTTEARTSEGGSSFTPVGARNPLQLPVAAVSVLFRPFPWEAHNIASLVASAEGTVLLGMFVVGWRRVTGAVRVIRRSPYLIFLCVYSLLFIFAFSSIGNFGIIARQRVQVLPLVLMLLGAPHPRRARAGRTEVVAAADPAVVPAPAPSMV